MRTPKRVVNVTIDANNVTLPHPQELSEALLWLRAGCPAWKGGPKGPFRHDPSRAIRTLIFLVEQLPQVLPVYAWGTTENKAAYLALETKNEKG